MFNLLFWSSNVFEAKVLNWYSSQYKLTKFWLLILVRKIHILAKKMVPHIFYQTPRFPSDPAFSTPWDPVPRTRIFHLSKENRNTSSVASHDCSHIPRNQTCRTDRIWLVHSKWVTNLHKFHARMCNRMFASRYLGMRACAYTCISTEINSDFWAGQFQVWILRPITYTKRTDFPWPSVTYT